ncbi:MAG TPA: response regulator [Steroidobacteraceae bacterium]|jgi:HD-like signal output (HDOD) protein/ActR/RegA family two-component response regulator|nr:response regulator [Steroidobacteraceae bacterium]
MQNGQLKRILFVDDEPALLDGLRGRLRGMRTSWEMVFVESGTRAIAEMEHRPVDVIVSDMRMPAMDGAQLLAQVSDRWPETVRIILSGYSEEEQARRLLPIAHQFLSKPCEPAQIEGVVNRCLRLHQLLREPTLRAVVGRVKSLPTLPSTYTRLRDAMAQEDTSVQTIAKIVGEDPAIAAKVLQVVNSAFFRLARRITKIDQAVNYLGLLAIRNLVMSVEVFSRWDQERASGLLSPEMLQTRAHRVAAVARELAKPHGIGDDALLAGLFHNIGYWVLMQGCAKELESALQLAREKKISLHEAERQILGASHAEVGAYLLGLWGLPHDVVEAVAFQYSPQLIEQKAFDVLGALVTAESVAFADAEVVPGVIERAEVPVDEGYLQSLGAKLSLDQAKALAASATGELS